MLLYRNAGISFLIHVAVLACFTLTVRGTQDIYRINYVFLGAILRHQEVSSSRVQPAAVVDLGMPRFYYGNGVHEDNWRRGIQVEKPGQAEDLLPRPDELIPRFLGERVEPDQANMPKTDAHLDEAPLEGGIKLRLDRR